MDNAFKRFFNGTAEYPKFKNKYFRQSFKINNILANPKSKNPQYTIQVDQKKHKVLLPKLGWINFYRSHRLYGKIISATISRDPDGKYYISFLTENEVEINNVPVIDKEIGVDLGLTSYIVTSDGEKEEAPKYYKKSKKKLAREQRKFARKDNNKPKEAEDGFFEKCSSKRRDKQRLVVAKIHKKVANQRKDFLHNLSTRLINENQVICLETLAVKNMIQNRKLALAIADAAWGEFVRQIEYKGKWKGRIILKIGTFEPSSKTCHRCGHVKQDLTLKDRTWSCDGCGFDHIRDDNSAVYVLCVAKIPDDFLENNLRNSLIRDASAWSAEAGVELNIGLAEKRLITNTE